MEEFNSYDFQNLLPELWEEQTKNGYISEAYITEKANTIGVGISEIYGVVSFYSFLSTKPLGKHVIRICKNVPCDLKSAGMIINAIQEQLGVFPGETSKDGRFTFELTNCIGACDQAPAMLVDDDLHGNLTPEKIGEILRTYE
jgi:NADH:ubiquinone oxidoreductase subunit E